MKKVCFVLLLAACDSHPPVTVHRALATPCPATAGDNFGQDECLVDGDCANGGVCSCAPNTREYAGSSRNICVPANCHIDAECGPGGSCSPTVSPSCGGFYGVQGYYCHTPADSCTVDSECRGSQQGNCTFAPQTGHWACSFGFCAG
jgi:hypothetical protein